MKETMTVEKARIEISVFLGKALDRSSFIDKHDFDKIILFGSQIGIPLKAKRQISWSAGCTAGDVLDLFDLAA